MNTVRPDHCSIVLLAAGMSVRLGTPKQLLLYRGKSLLRLSIEAALGTGLQPLLVVLGANHKLLENEMKGMEGIRLVMNKEWKEGMAASIRCGVEEALKTKPDLEGLMIMVCDQPYVSTVLLKSIFYAQQNSGMPVVAANYQHHAGVPALFHKSFFNKLMELRGDTGARKLLKENANQVDLVPFPGGGTDIDTREDYLKLNALKEGRKE